MESKLASNNFWVDELFPPRFKLTTSFNCYEETSNTSHPLKTRHVQKIYEDVYSATASFDNGQELDKKSKSSNELIMKREPEEMIQASLKVKADPNYNENKTNRDVTVGRCIWSTDELRILRNSFKRSRLNNIRLSVLTRSLQKDCKHLKNICQEQAREILEWNKKYNDVRKQNKRMKIACRAFKQDAKKCNLELEECQELLNAAVTDRDSLELEFVQTKKELETKQKQCEMLRLEFENLGKLQDRLMKNQKIALGLIEERKIYELTTKLEETQLALEKEKNDHNLTKKALEHLRMHFTSGRG